jgi:hypothetical protein
MSGLNHRLAAALLALLPAAAPLPAAAQDAPAVDSAVALVRSRFTAIQTMRLDSVVLPYTSPGGSGTVTTYRERGAARKIVVKFDGDGASWTLEHYYWADSLIFAFRRWERFPESGPSLVSERRWYVAGGRVLRILALGEDGRRRTIRASDPDFSRESEAVLSEASCWRRHAAAGREAEASC